jgi:NAD(P)-dependent dehydrogenase (short-subunit alcohol dehydrogenase family)
VANFEKSFLVNTIGPAMVAKHLLPKLSKDKRAVFAVLSARVGSISDNRLGGWYAYRAAKAALNMLIKSISIEVARRQKQAIIVGLHPGTVNTRLSEPFQSRVPSGSLFTSDHAVQQLAAVLDGLEPEDTGKVFAWDGQQVPS